MLKLPNHIKKFGVIFDCPKCKKCYLTERKLKNHKCPPLGIKNQQKFELEIFKEKKSKISLFSETSSSVRSASEESCKGSSGNLEGKEPRSRELSKKNLSPPQNNFSKKSIDKKPKKL